MDEGEATATLGTRSCVLTTALPEDMSLPPTGVVQEFAGADYVVVSAIPTAQQFACKLETAEGDRL